MDQLYIDNLARFENVILNDFDFSHTSPRKLANMAYEFGWNNRGAAPTNNDSQKCLCEIENVEDDNIGSIYITEKCVHHRHLMQ